MADIRFETISKSFGTTKVVEDFNLDIHDGEFVVMVGPSGCGKTTSLRMLAGLEQPSGGRVIVGGNDITDVPAKARELAMVFQSYALYPHMSVEENIGFALSLKKVSAREIREQVIRSAKRLEIDHLLARKPRELSGGQRQRVAVARAIIRQPKAFLFDEPLSNLDAKLRHNARIEIRSLQQQMGTTTVYVTHDQIEAMTMADRIVVMEAGRIRQIGTPMEVYLEPANLFVASFLGAPPTNCIAGRVHHNSEQALFSASGLEVPVSSRVGAGKATLGIRPESLCVGPGGKDHLRIEGIVRYVEALGAETLVNVEIQGAPDAETPATTVTARLPGHHIIRPDEALQLSVGRKDLRLFDANGEAIEGAAVEPASYWLAEA